MISCFGHGRINLPALLILLWLAGLPTAAYAAARNPVGRFSDSSSLPGAYSALGSQSFDSPQNAVNRLGVSESGLSPGAGGLLGEPIFWPLPQIILAVTAVLLVQAALIFVLLAERKKRLVTQATLDERLRYEELVAELSARFVHLEPDKIDDQIVASLGEVAQFLNFQFSALSIFTGPAVGRVAFIWQAPGTPKMPTDLTEKDFPWIAKELFSGRDVSFLSPDELPAEAAIDRATHVRIHNRSVHCVPLLVGETPVGVLNVGTFDREQGIAPDLLRRLRLLGEIFTNALARKRADEVLRASEEQMALAAESANLGVWGWDLLNNSIWVTDKCRELYGVAPGQEILLQTLLDILHEGDRKRVLEEIERALKERANFAAEYRVVLPGGAVRWIGAFGRGYYNGAGETTRMLGVSIDITARKRMEETLTHEREFLRQVIDVDPNFIFAKDRDGRFTLANQAVAAVYGTTVEGLIGKTDADFNPNAEEVAFFREMDNQVMDTRRERFIPNEMITDARGQVHYLQTVKRPLVDHDGNVTQLLGSATDITRRREAEIEAARQREEMAHVTRVATMGELAASLAHELNQPLTAILSNAQAAQRFLDINPVNLDEVREILTDIVADNTRASEVIRKMRTLVRKEPFAFSAIDLSTIIREVQTLLHSDAVLRNVEVQSIDGYQVPLVRGDKIPLQQVLLNLFLNAFDAVKDSPVGARDVAVRIRADDPGMVEVAVADNGHGLSGDMLDKIFEPFVTTKREGMGMGLCISRAIVEAHGGRLWAENNDGPGATFYFTVPVLDAEAVINADG